MTEHEYTPDTAYVRNAYVDHRYNIAAYQGEYPPAITERFAEFDRWLAEHDDWIIRKWTAENNVVPHERYTQGIAAAEQRGAERALRDFKRFAIRVMPKTMTRMDVITDIEVALKRLTQDNHLLMGPLRADQHTKEGDE